MSVRYRVTKLGYVVFSSFGIAVLTGALYLSGILMPSVQMPPGDITPADSLSQIASDKPEESSESTASVSEDNVNNQQGSQEIAKEESSDVSKVEEKAALDQELEDAMARVLFEADAFDLDSRYYPAIDRMVALAVKFPEQKLRVEGNYNGYPDNKYAKFWTKLASDRADVVKAYLVAKGVSPDRIVIVNNGCTKMIHKNESIDELMKNRRVDITFILK